MHTDYLRRSDAAAYLKKHYGAYTTETLAKLTCVGGGPVFKKFGRFPSIRGTILIAGLCRG